MNFLKFKSFKILDIIDTLKFKKKKHKLNNTFYKYRTHLDKIEWQKKCIYNRNLCLFH